MTTAAEATASAPGTIRIDFSPDEYAVLVDAMERACADFDIFQDTQEDYERCAALRDRITWHRPVGDTPAQQPGEMPRPDRARAEPAAIRRAAPSPGRHVVEGDVWVTDTGCGACGDAIDIVVDGMGDPFREVRTRLHTKRVRITIEVLPPGGDAE